MEGGFAALNQVAPATQIMVSVQKFYTLVVPASWPAVTLSIRLGAPNELNDNGTALSTIRALRYDK